MRFRLEWPELSLFAKHPPRLPPKTSTALSASGSRVLACLLAALLALFSASVARADGEDPAAIDKVTKMNRKAVEEYDNLNFEEARKILKDALDVCSQNGLDKHPIKARTHLHLGVVILAGFKQREVAIKQFRKALEIQPDIKLTKSLANPEIQEAFDEAVEGAGKPEGGGTGTGAGGGNKDEQTGDKAEKSGDKAVGEGGGDEEKPAEPFMHKPVTQATQGRPIPIEVVVDPALGAKKIVLAYRAGESGDFLGREMKAVSSTKWAAEIPSTATGGNRVSYYVEAQKEDGESLASKGSSDDPLVVSIKGAGAPEPKEPGEDEDQDRHWYIGLGFGSGIGWATGSGEVNVDHKISPAGFAPSGLGHVLPEVGYFVKSDLLLSVQLRFQYITGPTEETTTDPTECGGDGVCSPAKSALALFGRVTKFFGDGDLHPYITGVVGAGYVRHVADFPSVGMVCGANGKQECVDTVKAGPLLIGPGGGVLYNLSSGFALTLGVSTYIGVPDFTYQIDFNGGVAVEF
jgi:hypothetical protein